LRFHNGIAQKIMLVENQNTQYNKTLGLFSGLT
jgi:hypothetical protein